MKDTRSVATALRNRIRDLVTEGFAEPACRAAIVKLLSKSGFAFDDGAPLRAGVLAVECYRAVRGGVDDRALTAGAAVEIHMEAAYALDDIVDGQASGGESETLATALALLAFGNTLACEVARDAGDRGSGFAPLLAFHRDWATACSGFFLDAHSRPGKPSTLDDALDMTVRKSGALGRFASAFGAGVATNETDLITRLGDLGEALFTYRQLVDDMRDACSSADGPSDFSRHKMTLPLVYFYNYIEDRDGPAADGTIAPRDSEFCDDYKQSGAHLYAAIVAETFLNRTKKAVASLRAENLAVRNLENLIATIEAGSCDTVPT